LAWSQSVEHAQTSLETIETLALIVVGGMMIGALCGAAALILAWPPTLPLRHEIVVVTFGVVVFSFVVQGLTMPLLLRRLGFLPK
jgi:NhaP-type Na+/H+ or K+/H+ antiporter